MAGPARLTGSIPTHAGKPGAMAAGHRPALVYPHACGETVTVTVTVTVMPGLSPRMRGNPGPAGPAMRRRRSIPTHAGKPRYVALRGATWRVYPHACGETACPASSAGIFRGLSPRMRGNPEACGAAAGQFGSIPTHAGKPAARVVFFTASRVYPHACGETSPCTPWCVSCAGLSPRMRGNRLQLVDCRHGRGSIPTHAGKPGKHERLGICRRVYPHACGETHIAPTYNILSMGLSPRMRGNHVLRRARDAAEGSIPTHAGKPSCGCTERSTARVYPHACGETMVPPSATSRMRGLSPRMRGNQVLDNEASCGEGSIPTHAGKPTGAPNSAEAGRVYPHACGETWILNLGTAADEGLSPRMRGNL